MVAVGAAVLGGQFVGSPVFAEGPININILQVVDEETGEEWQDIVGAMPGATYPSIPRVKNRGSVPVEVRMCLSESATNAGGETIAVPAKAFEININENWTLDNEGETNVLDPAAGNCYKHNVVIEPGAVTEPLFTEVALSAAFENEHKNATFSLHLEAEAIGDLPVEPDDLNSPDTGADTWVKNFVINSGLMFLLAGMLALIVAGLRKIIKK